LGSRGIHVEQPGGRKVILRQPSNGLGVNVEKNLNRFAFVYVVPWFMGPWLSLKNFLHKRQVKNKSSNEDPPHKLKNAQN
jgi:hypothetical protein